jgi:hypothetical protein
MIQLDQSSFTVDPARIALYYDRYLYRARLSIEDIHYFRGVKNSAELYNRVQRLNKNYSTVAVSSAAYQLFDWMDTYQSAGVHSARFQQDAVDIYSNDIIVLQDLVNQVHGAKSYILKRCQPRPGFDRSIVYLAKPKARYRIYFRWIKAVDIRPSLREFIEHHGLRPSESFRRWLTSSPTSSYVINSSLGYQYLWDNYFIDFDDEMITTIMTLKFGDIIRRVSKIEKR